MTRLIKKILPLKLLRPFAMVQFGPPRSGSTLVFNIMNDLFPRKKIFKVHTYRLLCEKLPVVATYRHPFDSVASSLIRYGHDTPSDELVDKQIATFLELGLNDISHLLSRKDAVVLKYEEFSCDFNVIFDALEKLSGISISPDTRNMLQQKYNIENVEKSISSMKDFTEHDKKALWHGKHISKHKGATGYYKEFFTKPQIARMEEAFKEFMELMGYST